MMGKQEVEKEHYGEEDLIKCPIEQRLGRRQDQIHGIMEEGKNLNN